MNQKTLVEQVLAGRRLCVVTYVVGKAETMRFRPKGSLPGTPLVERPSVQHLVLSDGWSIKIQERLPDGATVAGHVNPFRAGQKLVLHLDSLAKKAGDYSSWLTMADIEVLEDDVKAK